MGEEPVRPEKVYSLICKEKADEVVRKGIENGGVAEKDNDEESAAPRRSSQRAAESMRVVRRDFC